MTKVAYCQKKSDLIRGGYYSCTRHEGHSGPHFAESGDEADFGKYGEWEIGDMGETFSEESMGVVVGDGHPKDNQISLLRCLLEKCRAPEHITKYCETNDCPRCEFDVWKTELEAPYVPRGKSKPFPMLDEPRTIPWELGIAIWETLYNPLFNDQTAGRLAERGGFSWEEVKLMARKMQEKKG